MDEFPCPLRAFVAAEAMGSQIGLRATPRRNRADGTAGVMVRIIGTKTMIGASQPRPFASAGLSRRIKASPGHGGTPPDCGDSEPKDGRRRKRLGRHWNRERRGPARTQVLSGVWLMALLQRRWDARSRHREAADNSAEGRELGRCAANMRAVWQSICLTPRNGHVD